MQLALTEQNDTDIYSLKRTYSNIYKDIHSSIIFARSLKLAEHTNKKNKVPIALCLSFHFQILYGVSVAKTKYGRNIIW